MEPMGVGVHQKQVRNRQYIYPKPTYLDMGTDITQYPYYNSTFISEGLSVKVKSVANTSK